VTEAISVASALVGLIGLLLWAREESKVDYAPPAKGVGPKIYQHLEQARSSLFKGSPDVRFTIFAPDTFQPDVLQPIARLGWGLAAAHSRARFRKGEGLAGIAWSEPELIVVADLGPFTTEEAARQAQNEVLKLRPETAAALSSDQLRAQVLIATALKSGHWFKGVLCIDCLNPKLVAGKVDQRFWLAIERLSAALAPLVPPTYAPSVEVRQVKSVNGATLRQVRFEKTRVSEGASA